MPSVSLTIFLKKISLSLFWEKKWHAVPLVMLSLKEKLKQNCLPSLAQMLTLILTGFRMIMLAQMLIMVCIHLPLFNWSECMAHSLILRLRSNLFQVQIYAEWPGKLNWHIDLDRGGTNHFGMYGGLDLIFFSCKLPRVVAGTKSAGTEIFKIK